jgi:hypothetical protein
MVKVFQSGSCTKVVPVVTRPGIVTIFGTARGVTTNGTREDRVTTYTWRLRITPLPEHYLRQCPLSPIRLPHGLHHWRLTSLEALLDLAHDICEGAEHLDL